MEYFHGSVVQGLSERKPHASPFSNFKEPMLDICKDGTLVFQEMFSGALAYFYKGVSGCIYRCLGDYEINSDVGVHTCATSRTAVPVTDFEYVESAPVAGRGKQT